MCQEHSVIEIAGEAGMVAEAASAAAAGLGFGHWRFDC